MLVHDLQTSISEVSHSTSLRVPSRRTGMIATKHKPVITANTTVSSVISEPLSAFSVKHRSLTAVVTIADMQDAMSAKTPKRAMPMVFMGLDSTLSLI